MYTVSCLCLFEARLQTLFVTAIGLCSVLKLVTIITATIVSSELSPRRALTGYTCAEDLLLLATAKSDKRKVYHYYN